MLTNRRRLALAAAVGLAALAGCSASLEIGASSSTPSGASPPPPAPAAPVVNVTIKLFRYDPETVTVVPGTMVLWTNDDEIGHTVKSGTPDKPGGPLDGNLPTQGSTYSYRFDAPGEYPYFCQIHNSMVGDVIVKQP